MASLFDYDSVNEFLSFELDRRKRKNQNYSMRAYARDLGVSVSRLSEIISGDGSLSEKMASKIGEKLKFNLVETKYWFDLVLAKSKRNAKIKNLALDRLEKAKRTNRLREVKEAEFRVMADWYHFAILELTEVEGFQSSAAWVAEQLGISAGTATAAIERLKKLGLIFEKDGVWSSRPEAFQVFSATPSIAIQKFHSQILSKALFSLQNDPIDQRLFQSMIVAIPRSQLPLFNEKMKTFLQNFWEDLGDTTKDDLYSLSVQMVPVRNSRVR